MWIHKGYQGEMLLQGKRHSRLSIGIRLYRLPNPAIAGLRGSCYREKRQLERVAEALAS
ncbi:MAG: hypothetical protein ABFS02_00140 [Pseudomonadota bacterium]